MTDTKQPIAPDTQRQVLAIQLTNVFNSMHEYLATLQHKNEAGQPLMTAQLSLAHQRIDEAAMWAVKHVLATGVPAHMLKAANSAPPAPAEGNDTLPTAAPAETPHIPV